MRLDLHSKSEETATRTLADIRRRGFSLVRGDLVPEIDAMAVPVLDFKNDLVAVLAAVGPADASLTPFGAPPKNATPKVPADKSYQVLACGAFFTLSWP